MKVNPRNTGSVQNCWGTRVEKEVGEVVLVGGWGGGRVVAEGGILGRPHTHSQIPPRFVNIEV